MAFFGITESRQGFVMTIQSPWRHRDDGAAAGLFGERLHKLYGLLAGAVLVGVAGVTIGTMPLYGNDSYGLLLVFALIGGVGYITIDLLMNGVIADVFPEKKSTLLPIVHGFYGLGAMLAPLLVTWLDSGRPATFAVPYSGAGRGGAGVGRGILGGVPPRHAPHSPSGYDGSCGTVPWPTRRRSFVTNAHGSICCAVSCICASRTASPSGCPTTKDRAPHGRRRGQRHAHPVFPGRTGGPYALAAGV